MQINISNSTRLKVVKLSRDVFVKHDAPMIINIRIHHECEGRIEKSVLRITDWHHTACRVMTNGDRQGQVFPSHPHTINGFFFLLTTKYLILY